MSEEVKSELLSHLQTAFSRKEKKRLPLAPLTRYSQCGDKDCKERGGQLLSQGRVASIILAGGMGSRLRSHLPKGCVPLNASGITLYQLMAEKVKTKSCEVGYPLELAIMTSQATHEATIQYFTYNHRFGLEENQLHFFCQSDLPLLDFDQNPFLNDKGHVIYGPSGNGDLYQSFKRSQVRLRWQEKKIQQVSIIPIDNPFADPFDAECFGFQAREKADIVIKAAFAEDPKEKVGLLLEEGGRVCIVEYDDVLAEERAIEPRIANLGLFFFSLDFMNRASDLDLPLHAAKKAVRKDPSSEVPSVPNSWKLERFIFDAFSKATRISTILYPRALCFAPLKTEADLAKMSELFSVAKDRIFN